MIAACQQAGAQECSRDEVTNDSLCVVSVGSDDTGVVSGGAGPTVEAARTTHSHMLRRQTQPSARPPGFSYRHAHDELD